MTVDVMQELKGIGPFYASGDFAGGIARVEALWERIEGKKTTTPNSFGVIEYGVAFALKLGDMEAAKRWADRAPPFRDVLYDVGDVELLMGKVAFETGDLETAKRCFLVADEKSEGRALSDADPKYRKLLKAAKRERR